MEVIIVNNKGRCSRCSKSEKKFMPKNNYPLLDDDKELIEGNNWFFCHKYGRYCRGIAGHCKAPQEGYHDSSEKEN